MSTSNDLVDIDVQGEDDDAVVVRVDSETTGFPFRVYSSETEGNLMTIDPDGSIGAPLGRFPQLTTDYISYSSAVQSTAGGTVQASTAARDVHISTTGNTTLELSETSVPTNAEHQITIKNTHGSNTITITLNDALWIKPASANVFTLGPGAWYSFRIKRIEGAWVVQSGTTSTGISLIVTGLVWKGAYSGATSYSLNDVVSYNGSSYVNILQSVGNNPTNTTYFSLLAAKGDTGSTGSTGSTGATGATGTAGRNAGLYYQFSSDTTNLPAQGKGLSFNNATPASVTTVRFHKLDEDGGDVRAYLNSFGDSTSTVKGVILFQKQTDLTKFAIYEVTAVNTNPGGAGSGLHTALTVTYVASNSTFSDDSFINVQFYRTGDAA